MAEEPEQLGLANKDQAAQEKALDQLTDHVRIGSAVTVVSPMALLRICIKYRWRKKNSTPIRCPQPWLVL